MLGFLIPTSSHHPEGACTHAIRAVVFKGNCRKQGKQTLELAKLSTCHLGSGQWQNRIQHLRVCIPVHCSSRNAHLIAHAEDCLCNCCPKTPWELWGAPSAIHQIVAFSPFLFHLFLLFTFSLISLLEPCHLHLFINHISYCGCHKEHPLEWLCIDV